NGAGPNGMTPAFGSQPGTGTTQPGLQSALHAVPPGAPAHGAQPGAGLPGGPGPGPAQGQQTHGQQAQLGGQPGQLGQHAPGGQPGQHQAGQPQPGQHQAAAPGQSLPGQPAQFQNGQPQSPGLTGHGAHAAPGPSTSQSVPGIPAYQQGPAQPGSLQ